VPIVAHGIDIVRVDRVARLLAAHGERFLERCFTPAEAAYAADSRRRAEHLAVRFAAKEATFKALGVGWGADASWTDAAVSKRHSGEPYLAVTGRLAEAARRRGVRSWTIALSHTDGLAIASVVGDSEEFHRT
jgi:holo-[acyl-carrier protein] synthase